MVDGLIVLVKDNNVTDPKISNAVLKIVFFMILAF